MKSARSNLVPVLLGAATLCVLGCADLLGLQAPKRNYRSPGVEAGGVDAGPSDQSSAGAGASEDSDSSMAKVTSGIESRSEAATEGSGSQGHPSNLLDGGDSVGASTSNGVATTDRDTNASSSDANTATSGGFAPTDGDAAPTTSDGVEDASAPTTNDASEDLSTPTSDDDITPTATGGASSIATASTESSASSADESSNPCEGCMLDGECVADGTQKSNDECLICDTAVRTDAWVANVGVDCGEGATECSRQDTCNAQGQCAPNHMTSNEACGEEGSGYVCDGQGDCASACSPSQRYCEGQCTDVSNSKLHCGDCGEVCPLNGVCGDGECDLPGERSSLDLESDDGGYSLNGAQGACVGQWVKVLGDFDGDGKDELHVAGFEGGYVLKGSTRTSSLDLETMTNEGWFIHDSVDQQPLDGWVLSGGDINGDGRRDLTIMSGGNGTQTSLRVLFTPSAGLSDIDLASSTFDGFEVFPVEQTSYVEVSDAGDFNADGKDDLIMALPSQVLVLYGRATTTDLLLEDVVAEDAVQINVPDATPARVAGAGDVNADGKADVIVGDGELSVASVVYGRTGLAYIPIEVEEPAQAGFKMTGATGLGEWVGSAGDFNGDGFDDVVTGTGTVSWVIFGRELEDHVDVSNLGDAGIRIEGNAYRGAASDINGDGYSDLVLGDSNYGPDLEGAVYVVFGSNELGTLSLETLGARGQRLESFRSDDMLGLWVSSGDIDGDGFGDFLTAKSCVGNEIRGAFVVFGVP